MQIEIVVMLFEPGFYVHAHKSMILHNLWINMCVLLKERQTFIIKHVALYSVDEIDHSFTTDLLACAQFDRDIAQFS